MAKIIPFKAVRPTKEMVSLVVSRSYDNYSTEELEAQLQFNPYSFLHIINPGYKYQHEVSGPERFDMVRNRYFEFKEDGVFLQDSVPCLYVYKMQTRNNSCIGIFAGASTEDYENNVIKKHEDTIEIREELFKEYLNTVGFNAEPVLLIHPDDETVSTIIKQVISATPEYAFTTTDKISHYFWKISETDVIEKLQHAFDAFTSLYIADGHHRTASSHLLAKTLSVQDKDNTGTALHHFFMSYIIPESQLKIYEYNRLVKDLNGLSKEAFLIQLDASFRIENRGAKLYKPSKKHHFSMYLDGEFYSLYLRKSSYKFTDALSALDAQILYKTILEPILGIKDLRNDKRIDYGYGKYNVIQMKDVVDEGKYAVGFSLLPVTAKEIKIIADEGLKMPPKSTYIEPKLKSGLTIYEF